jgi:hypothetical protein
MEEERAWAEGKEQEPVPPPTTAVVPPKQEHGREAG